MTPECQNKYPMREIKFWLEVIEEKIIVWSVMALLAAVLVFVFFPVVAFHAVKDRITGHK
jgi:hypothetical protein